MKTPPKLISFGGVRLPEQLQCTLQDGETGTVNVGNLAINVQTHALGVDFNILAALVGGEGKFVNLTHQKRRNQEGQLPARLMFCNDKVEQAVVRRGFRANGNTAAKVPAIGNGADQYFSLSSV